VNNIIEVLMGIIVGNSNMLFIVTKKKLYFQYIKFFMATCFFFLTRSNEPSTLPCLHPITLKFNVNVD